MAASGIPKEVLVTGCVEFYPANWLKVEWDSWIRLVVLVQGYGLIQACMTQELERDLEPTTSSTLGARLTHS